MRGRMAGALGMSVRDARTCRSDSHLMRGGECVLMSAFCFYSKGVTDVLCEACDQLGWTKPTKIQVEAIPLALQGRSAVNRWPGTASVNLGECQRTAPAASSEIKMCSLTTHRFGGVLVSVKVLLHVYFLFFSYNMICESLTL